MKAKINDLDEIVKMDSEVIGDDRRRKYIQKAVEEERCIVIKIDALIVGFLIFDTHFFDCSFIALIIVKPTERRKGYATSLIQYFIYIYHQLRKYFLQPINPTKECRKYLKQMGS